MEVLCTKHPEARTPTAASLDSYLGRPPELTPLDITEDTVMAVAGRLSGGAEPGGVRLHIIAALDPAVWRRKCRAEVDCWGLRRVGWEWVAPLGRLSGTHEWPADRAGKAASYKAGRGGGDMETDDGKVSLKGGRTGGQGGLRHDATCGRTGGGDRGRHPRDARPLGGT